jgi:bifunctional non-homologous end joining protein LigD
MDRFPEGITGESFYQKNAGDYFPAWIKTKKVPLKSATRTKEFTRYVMCQNSATLIYIANQGCITPHMWLSKVNTLNYPDLLIFDLDPAVKNGTGFTLIRDTAYALKKIIEACGLSAWVMTTGSRGLHVRVPIKPEYTFDEVRAFAHSVAQAVTKERPNDITLDTRKENRGKRLLIDIMRNGFGATAVIPYAVRAHEKAPVATPLEWEELQNTRLRSNSYTIKTIVERLKEKGDVWHTMPHHARSLRNALKAFKKLQV